MTSNWKIQVHFYGKDVLCFDKFSLMKKGHLGGL